MNDDTQPTTDARALDAELFDRLALNADGQPFDDNDPETWEAADEAEPEVVHLGAARFKIIDADAFDLAVAAGAIEEGSPPTLCMRVALDPGAQAPMPAIGQFLVVATDEPNVSILLRVWLTYDDLHDPAAPDLGPHAMRNEALDVLEKDQALLVQVFDEGDEVTA
ncbi:hypothetical protein [Variovorax paradoxus]|uniref:hypothetical protein n=1 Tax=Variovorax paradoxus TaxID=34073 RepID=UPI002782F306|nr:hypothetical protein [Variovorax paradoxus]MDQ0591002.1 hypothetical protein [Variovorax paradoxus]